MRIERNNNTPTLLDEAPKCFEKFFIGSCPKSLCMLDHEDFNSEEELKQFCELYIIKIRSSFKKLKKTDELLQKYIQENLYVFLTKPEAQVSQKPNLKIEGKYNDVNEATEFGKIINFDKYFTEMYVESRKLIDEFTNIIDQVK